MKFGLGSAILVLGMVGCTPMPMPTASPVPSVARSPSPSAWASPSVRASPSVQAQCHAVDGLPDRRCTPGVVDPRVTQENIQTTICRSGYSATVRPPTSYTEPLKLRQMVAYGYGGQSPAGFEEDHLASIELAGSPTDPANLWPEAYDGPHGARVKDRLENELHRRVCTGELTLALAQYAEMTNWLEAYRLYVGVLP